MELKAMTLAEMNNECNERKRRELAPLAERAPRRYILTPAERDFFRRHFAARANIEGAINGALQLIADQQKLGGAKFQLADDCAELVEVEEKS
jgi:hypothetical protein